MFVSIHPSSATLNPVPKYRVKQTNMTPGLTIGKLAETAGVNVETIRYYQRRGLLIEPDKPQSGYRCYPANVTKRLRFIKRAQALGFTLTEVGGLLTLDETHACAETQGLAARKLALMEQKIADLTAMRRVLRNLLQQCDAGNRSAACPIIDVLARE